MYTSSGVKGTFFTLLPIYGVDALYFKKPSIVSFLLVIPVFVCGVMW